MIIDTLYCYSVWKHAWRSAWARFPRCFGQKNAVIFLIVDFWEVWSILQSQIRTKSKCVVTKAFTPGRDLYTRCPVPRLANFPIWAQSWPKFKVYIFRVDFWGYSGSYGKSRQPGDWIGVNNVCIARHVSGSGVREKWAEVLCFMRCSLKSVSSISVFRQFLAGLQNSAPSSENRV